jgi:hypothetical protein
MMDQKRFIAATDTGPPFHFSPASPTMLFSLFLIMRLITFIATVLLFFGFGRLDAKPAQGSLIAAKTDSVLQQDSLEATTDIMVPYRAELIRAAHKHNVPASLLAAFCQEESAFNPWAERTEPTYLANKTVKASAKKWALNHKGLPTAQTELGDRSKSMGLMQPMGELAREQGFDSEYLSALFEPFNSIDQGAILLKKLLARYGKDTLSAISAYNQGSARRTHGTFENAQYVYRVSVAWRHYDKALHYANLHNKPGQNIQMAGRDRDTTHDRGRASEPQLQPKSDTTAGIAQNNGHTNGSGPIATGYDLGSRHDPDKDLPPSQSQSHDRSSVFDGLPADLYLGLAAILSVIVLGFAIDLKRYLRKRAGYHLDLPRRSERHFLSRSEIQPSRTNLSRSFHAHG